MKLYWGPHTCAIGIHVLLEEIGRPYETQSVDVGGGENRQPPFFEINPKGKVPTLVRDDGSVLTEFGAIAGWLARTNPDAGLLPEDPDDVARVEEVVAYIEGTIHGQGYARIFVPAMFEPQDLVHGKLGLGQVSVKGQGRQIVETGFAILDPQLSRRKFAAGDTFSIADAALFYAERWAASNEIMLPMHVQAHFDRITSRPSVRRVMEIWGEAPERSPFPLPRATQPASRIKEPAGPNVEPDEVTRVFALQRESRWVAKSSSAAERVAKLERLRGALLSHAHEVNDVLAADLGRPPEQPASLEVEVVLADIGHAIENLERWMAPVPASAAPLLPMPEIPGTEMFVQHEGRGVVLIFGAWNQPFMLLLQPLVAAIAAGNVAIVKPNELTPASSRLIATIVREAFDEAEVAAFEGGVELADRLLELPVDHVFFTGSPAVGRKVAAAAARHLASVTLELGGKSPAIVDGTANLKTTAAIIASGKLYNAGQVCISFDHVWIRREARDEFVRHYVQWIADNLYEDGALRQGVLTRMVDRRNYDRVVSLVADAEIAGATVIGPRSGVGTDLVIEPMVLVDVPTTSRLMHDEIFGPILPVLAFDEIGEVTAHLRSNEKPLALYAFSTDHTLLDRLLRETSSGGVTVNAWASHAFESSLPFGGIGNSGSGHYRGEFGFRELTHARSVVAFARPFDSVSAVNG